MTETGTCAKCRSDIPIDAVRCPACGYEPSSLSATDIVVVVASALLAYGVFAFGVTVLLTTAAPGIGPVELTVATVAAAIAAAGVAWWQYTRRTRPALAAHSA